MLSKLQDAALLLALTLLIGCKGSSNEKPEQASSAIAKETTPSLPVKEEKTLDIHYTALPIKQSDSGRTYFKDQFSEEEKNIIYGLNRVDAKNVNRVDTLIIPDTFLMDWLLYSPFPREAKMLEPVEKLILFSYPIQAFAAYENGKLVRWGPTSMGSKAHPTPTGLHFANWKSKKSISSVKDEWILPWNFNIMNQAGVGWHEYSMPGYPASHSCLRLHEEDAIWLYGFAEQWILENDQKLKAKGTPVIVFGAYPFGERRPWYHLLEDAKANALSDKELERIIEPHLPEILKQQEIRESVFAVE